MHPMGLPPTSEQIAEWIDRLRSRFAWTRAQAVEELVEVDFERLERPPQVSLLLAAMNAPELRDKAPESLTRVLRGLEPEEHDLIDHDARHSLRKSIRLSKPHRHADFLVEVSSCLLRLRDFEAIPLLENLVERCIIRQHMAEKHGRGWGTTRNIERGFRGYPAEEHDVRRVRSAAHVACERLKLMAETAAAGGTLLHPELRPDPEDLLRPAIHSHSDPEHLLRSDSDARP